MSSSSDSLFRIGETCHTLAPAGRAALLIDAEAYFTALRQAMLKARHSIHIIGWDIDSRTDLAPHLADAQGNAPDGAPTRLKPLIEYITRRQGDISIRLLLWDFTMLYATDREPLPRLTLDWVTPPQVEVCLDDVLPFGASHHQKLVVIDDALAFCGGIDLTTERWDTRAHTPEDTRRRAPGGTLYEPFHDMQMMVDGAAAHALAKVAHQRWYEARCVTQDPVDPAGDPWPEDVVPQFRNTDIAVALTMPMMHERPEVRHIEALVVAAIGLAERCIYIENQYLTAPVVADALASRLEERPELEVVVVTPKTPAGWLESRSMGAGRLQFRQRLEERNLWDRLSMVYPVVHDSRGGRHAVKVHAKLMIVDEAVLIVGSANFNNRSMGFDTELNVAIHATTDADRARIGGVRDDLVAEHLGMTADAVQAALHEGQSLSGLFANADPDATKSVMVVDDVLEYGKDPVGSLLRKAADPERPLDLADLGLTQYAGMPALRPRLRKAWLGAVVLLIAGLALLWTGTPLAEYADLNRMRPMFEDLQGSGWAPVLVIGLFLAGGLVVFPVTVLITLTALVFPPLPAFFYAVAGVLVSSLVTYGVGWAVGRSVLRRMMGRRLNAISRRLSRKGMLTVIALRVLPIAPFSLINLVVGASHIRLSHFLLGTAVGMIPGIAVLTAMGESLWALADRPTPANVAVVGGILLLWFGLGFGLQRLVEYVEAVRNRD